MHSLISHPQPLGIFPFPAGLLLLPNTDDVAAPDARSAFMRGAVPEALPEAWQFYSAAIAGDRDVALGLLAGDTSPVAGYNRYVLEGDAAGRNAALASDDAALPQLTQLAAFVQGETDTLPDPESLQHELRATVQFAAAAHALDEERTADAAALLTDGVACARTVSPVLAAQLLAQLAQVQSTLPDASVATTLTQWRTAIALAGDTPLPNLRGDLRVGLAIALQEAAGERRELLVEAIKTYQEALRAGITLEDTPETFALVQNNIGLAYLTMPMTDAGDKLRHAVAVQSFREALKVYTAETHTEAWSSTMLNMANAFQYLPTSHPEENLIQAVETYEQLLGVRNKAFDPLGYARILANQANALAHLGMFQPATEKYTEAHKLLHWHGEADLAATILVQLERINAQLTPAAADDAPAGGVEG